ncbi:MAG TPA: hypothetical protein EYM81_06855 [Candidatus Poseidoniales archaeon]|nr:MAG: hypothetical protein CXX81_07030 [Euryarchaeota archaeon]HIN45482.1 hypothetical protein [Candidatus Poseidoniales archaeon]
MSKTLRPLLIVLILLNSSAMLVSAEDSDGDGFEDGSDDCPTEMGSSTEDRSGCPDSDEDGWSDQGDSYPDDPTQWADSDGDGYGDNPNGNWGDAFPNDPTEWEDSDGDGYGDNSDGCPTTYGESNGCPDSDGDGVLDMEDVFPSDSTQWSDVDGDGYGDNPDGYASDTCPDVAGTSFSLSMRGCTDIDGDGYADPTPGFSVADGADSYPDDATRWGLDDDMDGFEDGSDDCPTEMGSSTEDRSGCPDSDEDGWSDQGDSYPNDPTQWADSDMEDVFPSDPSQWSDMDGDGFGDNATGYRADSCPDVVGTSTIDVFGCPDVDGDGISDIDKLLWGANSLDVPNDGYSGSHLTNTQEFDMSKESATKCVISQGIKVCVQFVILIIGDVDGETTLDVQINDNLEGTSDISINSDFDVTNSQLRIKPELRISFRYDKYGVDEDFNLYFPTPNRIYPGQTYSSLLELYYWDEYLVLDDTFNYDDESNRIEIASVNLAPIITERWETATSTSPMGRVVSTILDETFNLRIPLSVGFYVDTTSEYNTVSIGVLDGARQIQSDQRCIDGCTATVNNNNTTSSLSVYTFAKGTVTVDIGGYLSIGIEIDMYHWFSGYWEVNAYTKYRDIAQISFLKGSSSTTFDGLSNTYTFAVSGCTNSDALNQNVNAVYDDGSCIYPESTSKLSGSVMLYAGAGIGVLLFAIVVVLLFSRRISNRSDDELSGQGNEAPIIVPSYSPPPLQTSPDSNMQGNLAENGYEWIEYPPGQGEWYWRDQSTGEWVRHEG